MFLADAALSALFTEYTGRPVEGKKLMLVNASCALDAVGLPSATVLPAPSNGSLTAFFLPVLINSIQNNSKEIPTNPSTDTITMTKIAELLSPVHCTYLPVTRETGTFHRPAQVSFSESRDMEVLVDSGNHMQNPKSMEHTSCRRVC